MGLPVALERDRVGGLNDARKAEPSTLGFPHLRGCRPSRGRPEDMHVERPGLPRPGLLRAVRLMTSWLPGRESSGPSVDAVTGPCPLEMSGSRGAGARLMNGVWRSRGGALNESVRFRGRGAAAERRREEAQSSARLERCRTLAARGPDAPDA